MYDVCLVDAMVDAKSVWTVVVSAAMKPSEGSTDHGLFGYVHVHVHICMRPENAVCDCARGRVSPIGDARCDPLKGAQTVCQCASGSQTQ